MITESHCVLNKNSEHVLSERVAEKQEECVLHSVLESLPHWTHSSTSLAVDTTAPTASLTPIKEEMII